MLNEDIEKLSEKVLMGDDINRINKILSDLEVGEGGDSLVELAEVLGTKPKRPLYYISIEIRHLPKYGTRNIIRYSGDYIDQLVRFTLEDRRFLSRWFRSPLGKNIRRLKKYIDSDFFEILDLFNKIYTQAKHDFNHKEDKSFFNYKDAIYIIFITKKIAQKILPLSETARDYNNNGPAGYKYRSIE